MSSIPRLGSQADLPTCQHGGQYVAWEFCLDIPVKPLMSCIQTMPMHGEGLLDNDECATDLWSV